NGLLIWSPLYLIHATPPQTNQPTNQTSSAPYAARVVFAPGPAVTGSRREARDCGLQDQGTGQRYRRPKGSFVPEYCLRPWAVVL
ncbi:MAG: hypothetical protein ACK6EB_25370, partial [Planctomyces sp.]